MFALCRSVLRQRHRVVVQSYQKRVCGLLRCCLLRRSCRWVCVLRRGVLCGHFLVCICVVVQGVVAHRVHLGGMQLWVGNLRRQCSPGQQQLQQAVWCRVALATAVPNRLGPNQTSTQPSTDTRNNEADPFLGQGSEDLSKFVLKINLFNFSLEIPDFK